MTKRRPVLFALLLTGLVLLLSGCDMAVLDPKGIIAVQEKRLLVTAVLLMLTIVIPVIILTLVFAWRYRAGNTKAVYKPEWAHSTLLEVVCWTIPCIIVGILSVLTWTSSHALDPFKPLDVKTKPISIQVIALDWKWLFIYPEQRIATINEVVFPVDVPVAFSITSDAPMNSFFIPQLAGQIYAMAGMKTSLHVMANEVGDYRGFSANYTGSGFAGMKFVARAVSSEKFEQWVSEVKRPTEQPLTMETYNELVRPSDNNPVQYFSFVNDGLFDAVIMKYMMPMPSANMSMATMPAMALHNKGE